MGGVRYNLGRDGWWWTNILWQYLDKLRNISTHSMVVYWIVGGNHSSFDFGNYINFGVSLFFFFWQMVMVGIFGWW